MSTITATRSSSQASSHSGSGRDRSCSTRSKQPSLANISVRSFSDFRAQTSSVPSPSSVRRKPLPPNASPQVSCFSPTDTETQFGDIEDFTRPGSIDSNSSKQGSGIAAVAGLRSKDASKGQDSTRLANITAQEHARPDFAYPSVDKHTSTKHNHKSSQSSYAPSGNLETIASQRVGETYQAGSSPRPLQQDRESNGRHGGHPALIRVESSTTSSSKDSFQPRPQPSKSDMSIWAENLPRSVSDNSIGSTQTISPSKQQQANKFTAFFGWKSSPKAGPDSPSTPFTDRSGSPSASPLWPKNQPLDRSVSAPRLNVPPAIDTLTANGAVQGYQSGSPLTPYTAQDPSINAHFDELERELKEVSSELANSIRREMELEDEVDRYKGEPSIFPGEVTRRTSDYFSDSGSSAAKGSALGVETKIEELEKSKRRLEQEKASVRAEYSTKLADELRRRHDMEVHISNLTREHHNIQARAAAGADSSEKIRELETFLEETRRRLSQERQSRDNFEDLLAALRAELTAIRSERDNLVEEVVPQLKARVEGLEHENVRMQQEYGYPTANRSRVNSVAEDGQDHPSTPWSKMGGLARSNSLFNGVGSNAMKRSNSTLHRNGSVKARGNETVAEVKEIEDQRDALQKTLKNLIRRHEAQKRDHARAIQRLIADRDAAATISPRRTNFARNVATMKEEIVTLRRRVDDALTQKWQIENSFGGVKMALDRAEQETRSLRNLLGDCEDGGRKGSNGLGISIASNNGDESPLSMIKILRRSIQLAETERDAARREAEAYRQKARSLADRELAAELLESAERLDRLAASLHESVQKNIDLRERLAQALEKGEKEQSQSTAKITEMQSQLKRFEDSIISAQQDSENAFASSEELAKSTNAAVTPQVTRLTLNIPGPNFTGHRAGEGIFSARSPRLDVTRSGKAESMGETAKTAVLEKRLADLEKALYDADTDMKGVVERVERSRAEIAMLQGERETANQGMKKLQSAISEEKQRALRLMA
ncbi:hypothetical protein CAC42_7888 [Sphaceloma murrayae]|uniref:DUF7603 domain-containing protein n=1 Tax=Sphaceloma murrayae TaxID=2082308 RepID=A0A2K1QXY8_9PEZI|nr:hypothetical protein CAC42_7888 [Sphaceloma murrayae]